MIWKLLGLQKKLDALFDEGWVRLGLSSGCTDQPVAVGVVQPASSHA